jgi:hypothetical protein
MAVIFYIIGGLGVVLGFAWAGLGWYQPYQVDYGQGAVARALIVVPGLAVVGSSLIFLAIGGVLSRLDRIVANTGGAAHRPRGPALD